MIWHLAFFGASDLWINQDGNCVIYEPALEVICHKFYNMLVRSCELLTLDHTVGSIEFCYFRIVKEFVDVF